MKNKYNLGDKVWCVKLDTIQEKFQCPDCFGNKYLTVILGDNSQVTIDCYRCTIGYEPPLGYVVFDKKIVAVKQVIVEGINICSDYIEYIFEYNSVKEEELSDTKEEAEIKA